MKTLSRLSLLALCFSLFAYADSTLVVGVGEALPGSSGSIPVSLQTTDSVAGVQFKVSFDPTIITSIVGQPTPDITALSKSITCRAEADATICLIVGFATAEAIPDGATVAFLHVATTAAFSGVPIALSDLSATDPQGTALTIMSTPGTLNVGGGPCDLNEDGSVNVVDVQRIVNGSLQPGTCRIGP